jgi:hypothetical protein
MTSSVGGESDDGDRRPPRNNNIIIYYFLFSWRTLPFFHVATVVTVAGVVAANSSPSGFVAANGERYGRADTYGANGERYGRADTYGANGEEFAATTPATVTTVAT